jgi:hypothetical protein
MRLARTDPRPGCTAPANFETSPLETFDEFAGGLSSGVRSDYDRRNSTYRLLICMGFDVETARAGATSPQVLHAALSGQIPRRCA